MAPWLLLAAAIAGEMELAGFSQRDGWSNSRSSAAWIEWLEGGVSDRADVTDDEMGFNPSRFGVMEEGAAVVGGDGWPGEMGATGRRRCWMASSIYCRWAGLGKMMEHHTGATCSDGALFQPF
ncbi:hypothetical protein ACLOJK_039184 [Asimina triloba]